MSRYVLACEGQLSYGIEANSYTKEANPNQYFGFIEDDSDLPNGQNPLSANVAGGTQRRGPHSYSPEAREYAWPVPVTIYDHNIPLEIAIGERVISDVFDDGTGLIKVADKHTWNESNVLQTATVQHGHRTLDYVEWWIGTKANLQIGIAKGEKIKGNMDMVGAIYDMDESPSPWPSIVVPSVKPPFHFNDLFSCTLGATAINTLTGADIGWDNGLAANHHGKGRDAYSVSEDTAADKYDTKFRALLTDIELMKKAYNNDAPEDFVLKFVRGLYAGDNTINDALYITLSSCRVEFAPIPYRREGKLEGEVTLKPTNTEVSILTPYVAP